MSLAIRLTVPKHRTGVAVVCLNDTNQVLLLRHVFHPTVPWGLPGGWLDSKEKPAECAIRELREEIGLAARVGPVVHVARLRHPDHISIAYLAFLDEGTPNLSNEIIEAAWFGLNSLPSPLFPFTRQAIMAAHALNRSQETSGVIQV